MSAGALLEEAFTEVAGASGQLATMLVRRAVSRSALRLVARRLERALETIRRIDDDHHQPE